jgi:tetratricopeptide (TPR) repeat protein
MRKIITLLFLLTVLKLSATTFRSGILKEPAKERNTDSIKRAQGKADTDAAKNGPVEQKVDPLKTIPISHKTDTANALPQAGDTGTATSPIFVNIVDSLIVASAKQPVDSAKSGLTLNNTDSVNATAAIQPYNDPKIIIEGAINAPLTATATTPEENAEDPAHVLADNNPPISSLMQLDSLKATLMQEQIRQQQLRKLMLKNEQLKIANLLKINNLDSLKQELTITKSDTLKAILNTRIALKYLDYDTIGSADKRHEYQNRAIAYTLQAIREYSIYNDSTGLRLCYDNLARVYHAQKKFPQAKWFILQSNTLSRAKNDTPNIIASLLTLAAIKSDIKDYSLAMGDLNEALKLSITTHAPKTQVEVLKNFAQLYNLLQNYPKEAAVLKKRDSILDSIRKSDEALLAKIAMQKKKQELLQAKKKLLSAATKKPSRHSSPAKIASL